MKVRSLGKIVALSTLGVAALCFIVGAVSVTTMNAGHVIMGVESDGMSIAGKTPASAKRFFDERAAKRLARPAAVLQYKEKSWSIKPEDVGLEGKTQEAADAAYAVGREGSALSNLLTQMRCALFGKDITLAGKYDKDKLEAKLNEIKGEIDTAPISATVLLTGRGNLRKTKEKQGLSLDIAPIEDALGSRFEALEITARQTLEPAVTEPPVKDSDVAAIDTVLGSYTTNFFPGSRGDNIGIAAAKLDGKMVQPQQTFSFNDTVGRRTRDAGYKDAGVIIDGEPAIDVGGGVCQVSTTLYNAVMLAGLTPTVRSCHFLPSHYVPAGRDATVADGLLDFAFRNNLAHPVYLAVTNTGSELTISILGTRADLAGKTVALETEGPSTKPSLYRLWSMNGKVVEKEFMHTDTYS